MRFVFSLSILLLFLTGCGPQLSKQDLGTVEFQVPRVAGSEEPYPLPQLGPPAGQSDEPAQRRSP